MTELIYQAVTSSTLWVSLGSIATALMAYFTLRTLQQYRNREEKLEKRELIEQVIQPLHKEIGTFLFNFDQTVLVSTQSWRSDSVREKNPYLFARLSEDLRALMREFNDQLEYFKNVSTKKLPTIQDIVKGTIKDVLAENDYEIGEVRAGDIVPSYLSADIGGKHATIHLFTLIRKDISLDEYIDEFFKVNHLPDKELERVDFKVLGVHIKVPGTECFEKVVEQLRSITHENEEFKKYIEHARRVYDEAEEIKSEFSIHFNLSSDI